MLNENGKAYQYTYKIALWATTQEWEDRLNEYTNDGWQVDCHHLVDGAGGRTVFRKVERVKVMLIDAYVAAREIYSVVNSTEMYHVQHAEGNNAEKACRMICDKIKEVCEKSQ